MNNIKIYESPSCPKDSFYLVNNRQLEELKEFDKIFKRAQEIDDRQAILKTGLIHPKLSPRRQGKLE